MAKEIIRSYKLYASDIIPCILFDCIEDAENFDKTLNNYMNDKEALAEFDKAERQYASLYAVRYNINNGTFHYNLTDSKSEELIGAVEQSVEIDTETYDDGDCYTPLMNYIFNKIHPNYKED
jgi:hypothetical protein